MVKTSEAISRIRSQRGLMNQIARELKIGLASVSKWRRIPADRVVDVERITGIPRERLRPDLYRK